MTMTIVEGNLGSGEILSGPVSPYRYMVSIIFMMIIINDNDDDDNNAQELRVGWFSLLQGLFIVLL